MKVLISGDGRKGWAIKKSCTGNGNGDGGCGAILLVEQNDIYVTKTNCRDETDYFFTFRCPECGVETDFGDSEVPNFIIRSLIEKNRKSR